MKVRENWELVIPPFRAVSQAPLFKMSTQRVGILNYNPPALRNIINLRKKWKGICSQVPFIVLKYRQGCI